MKIWIFLVKFLFIGMLFIVSTENLYMKNAGDRTIFFNHFYSWVSELSSHISQITSYVINSEWLPSADENTQKNNSLFRILKIGK